MRSRGTALPAASRQPVFIVCLLLGAAWLVFPLASSLLPVAEPRYIHEYSLLPPVAAQIRAAIGPGECPLIFPIDEANANLYFLLKCEPPDGIFLFSAYPWYSRFNLPQQNLAALQASNPRWVIYFPNLWDSEHHNATMTDYITSHYVRGKEGLMLQKSQIWIMERR
jgi:hypothetical protein